MKPKILIHLDEDFYFINKFMQNRYNSFNDAIHQLRHSSAIIDKLERFKEESKSRFVKETNDPSENIVQCGKNTFDGDENYTINGIPYKKYMEIYK